MTPTNIASRSTPALPPNDGQTRVFFVLLPEFTLMSLSGVMECLRLANRFAEAEVYKWALVSEDGQPVPCSAGIPLPVESALPETRSGDLVILCGGLRIRENSHKPVINWLRRESRRGASFAGICTAAWTMAEAGLLTDRRATIHWENQEAFGEQFPDVELTKSVFTIDGPRMTSAGGTASIDLMLSRIAQDHGESLASGVADQMIYSAIRTAQDVQRLSVPTRIGVRHVKLAEVIQRMEQNTEEPISPATLAKDVGLSTRQLERLFRRYLSRSPKRYYMELRLQKARNLLLQTEMSVINVALACGFTSPSHFSKCYRAQYNTTPYRERGTKAAAPEPSPE